MFADLPPTMQDTIGKLRDYVEETTPKSKPAFRPFEGYEPTCKLHYPKFYKSLTEGFKENEGFTYLPSDAPNFFKSLISHGAHSKTPTQSK
ncbi:hypothetical protein GUITHDRAFT_114150 [Guillardia theta CCMP2712]|uniref:Uncharacterized protein n=1 Tax=Guillardia theta (strain CCMP2712) TaxID=905079 RepID=L1ITR1_GUITC|nr:hypothetical protein GUITHDRAFT_122617 [Guillardia theta CCMP2712]XP_005826628.1 hypothetical protein GUITHDRAFT_114147 [Guillardia theta CCMP2712]XP_005826629.1 hypothetical protein GUITHDRAFT_114148 [Guillardia theta CCMP2712]XP_005826630.1 hypothetical protein GUITHDRAFT_114149 [Guillardia theta CCMP2712]XP_005826631.1 hypothetical protein GUITHDRAFT_114150 [Guillardia theta CCMP2712]EKX31175.1 hypothetical protein GUITHDRAFT_122617 [Guillardia theta CCMP2712]EKX39648.1 hypothetical pro|eukprot:XP_005818155.1 hypothetical protein GUITHDRAFT_122617 [Guillardia theta CCMP2712]